MNSKQKGNFWERAWSEFLTRNGIKSRKDGMSGGGLEKSDVSNGMNAIFEVKAVNALNLKKAFKQAKESARLTHNTPYVIVHFDDMPADRFLVVMDNYDWLELVNGEKEVDTTYTDPKLKWAVRRVVDAAKDLLKKLPEE